MPQPRRFRGRLLSFFPEEGREAILFGICAHLYLITKLNIIQCNISKGPPLTGSCVEIRDNETHNNIAMADGDDSATR